MVPRPLDGGGVQGGQKPEGCFPSHRVRSLAGGVRDLAFGVSPSALAFGPWGSACAAFGLRSIMLATRMLTHSASVFRSRIRFHVAKSGLYWNLWKFLIRSKYVPLRFSILSRFLNRFPKRRLSILQIPLKFASAKHESRDST